MNRKELAIISLITFLTVLSWIIFELHHTQTTSTISAKENPKIIPLTPIFDNEIIKKLYQRQE